MLSPKTYKSFQQETQIDMFHDNDDSSSPLTPAKEETDEEIHLVFGA